jgi:hypothetical protein
MNRNLVLLAILASSFGAACPLLNPTDDPGDATTRSDTDAQVDTPAVSPCTTNRDCYTVNGNQPVCNPATGECIRPALPLMMPCETESDCRTYYNTSLVYCSSAKLCSMPCPMQANESYATTCGYTGERACGFDSICMCTSEQYCREGEICGTVAKRCLPRCTSQLDCDPIEGTTCDPVTGQCVK